MTLAEDLVTAAKSVLCPDEDRPYYTERQLAGIERDSCAVVEVVLRGVVERLRSDGYAGTPDWRDAYDQAANDLEMAADTIAGTP